MQTEKQNHIKDNNIDEWSWSNFETTNRDPKADGQPVDLHLGNDGRDYLESKREENYSDSENEDNDLIFEDMQLFFHAIGEPQLIETFLKNKITLGQLLEFEEQDLINCGVELVGDRKKILANTAQMHCEKWMPSSLHDMTAKSLLSSPGIYIALNDINKHIEYIGVTFNYLKRKLQRQPELLELGKDYVGVEKVSTELADVLKTCRSTHSQALSLQRELKRLLRDPTLRPSNHIDKKYLRNSKMRQYLPSIVVGALIAAFSIKLSRYLYF